MKSLMSILICLAVVFVSNSVADDVVLSAQAKLKQLGYYHGMVDGQMGSQTAAAIRRFQLAQKLKVTGEMNAQTLRRLGVAAPKMRGPKRAVSPSPGYVNLATLFKGGPFISVGPETQIMVIRQAQKNLKLLGYYGGPIDGLPSRPLVTSPRVATKRWVPVADGGRFDETTLKGLSLMPND
jgi:peptidoglycan hydrolase-like protein with peptidoglycan-binding domain